MQVYRGMDIGTAKATTAERAEVPHHLLDLAEPWERFTVARFQQAAQQALAQIESRGHRALLVGGTGLYLRAVVDRLRVPGEFPVVRIEPSNRRRVVRALEVTLGSGRPFSSFGPGLKEYGPTPFRMAGVWLPRDVVSARIASRLRAQVAAGFVDEARSLAASLSATARQALGYKELLEHLEGRATLDAAIDAAIGRTRAFARRQRMWFRRDPRITWLAAGEDPLALLPTLLGNWSS